MLQNRIAHVVPELGIGGVEVAIAKSYQALNAIFHYEVYTLAALNAVAVPRKMIWSHWIALLRNAPDVVVTSLWPSHLFGWLLKLRGSKWACFLHSSRLPGIRNSISHRFFLPKCDAVLADSTASAALAQVLCGQPVFTVPFVFGDQTGAVAKKKNRFVFVGRNSAEKRLDLAIGIALRVLSAIRDASFVFVIAGPVPRELHELKGAHGESIRVLQDVGNARVLAELAVAEYYISTSEYEGYSMSTREAVDGGCFVFYRNVGSIHEYVAPDRAHCLSAHEDMGGQVVAVCQRRGNIAPLRGQTKEGDEMTYTGGFAKAIAAVLRQ